MINYTQIKQQTDKEMLKMYLKCNKKELAEMLIAANKCLNDEPVFPYYPMLNYTEAYWGSGGTANIGADTLLYK